MKTYSKKAFSLSSFVTFSLLLHGIAGYTLARFGSYDFTRPVTGFSTVVVEQELLYEEPAKLLLATAGDAVSTEKLFADKKKREFDAARVPDGNGVSRNASGITAGDETIKAEQTEAVPAIRAEINGEKGKALVLPERAAGDPLTGFALQPEQKAILFAGRKGAEFLEATSERLSYQISLFSLPVGIAMLEAFNGESEIRITLTVRSNAVLSGIYPVSDFAETRLIGGRYIVSNYRQQEGAFRSDVGFTLCLPQKSVLWTDRLARVVVSHHLEYDDVLDILSGFYFLRNQPLEVGKTARLHIFDKQQCVDVPVEVLRRERVALPGFRGVDALVIRPGLPTDGLFRRSGDLLVWLTDDEFKVPVKMEITIPLGKVTAELISSEVERPEKKK
jgi:uncharacterized protein DUF3108